LVEDGEKGARTEDCGRCLLSLRGGPDTGRRSNLGQGNWTRVPFFPRRFGIGSLAIGNPMPGRIDRGGLMPTPIETDSTIRAG
jgi:hypothetical protein